MRTLLFLFILFVPLTLAAQTEITVLDNTLPLPTSGAEWIITDVCFNSNHKLHTETIEGDTIINDTIWYKHFRDNKLTSILRFKGQKVYYKIVLPVITPADPYVPYEGLLYDFGVSTGDIVVLPAFGGKTQSISIEGVKYTNINGKDRKTIETKYGQWIDGIGSYNGLYGYFEDFIGVCSRSQLICFKLNNVVEYHTSLTGFVDCAIVSSLKENEFKNCPFYIYPNPVTANSRFVLDIINKSGILLIYNSLGELKYQFSASKINDIEIMQLNLSQGIYFAFLQFDNTIHSIKFVIL